MDSSFWIFLSSC